MSLYEIESLVYSIKTGIVTESTSEILKKSDVSIGLKLNVSENCKEMLKTSINFMLDSQRERKSSLLNDINYTEDKCYKKNKANRDEIEFRKKNYYNECKHDDDKPNAEKDYDKNSKGDTNKMIEIKELENNEYKHDDDKPNAEDINHDKNSTNKMEETKKPENNECKHDDYKPNAKDLNHDKNNKGDINKMKKTNKINNEINFVSLILKNINKKRESSFREAKNNSGKKTVAFLKANGEKKNFKLFYKRRPNEFLEFFLGSKNEFLAKNESSDPVYFLISEQNVLENEIYRYSDSKIKIKSILVNELTIEFNSEEEKITPKHAFKFKDIIIAKENKLWMIKSYKEDIEYRAITKNNTVIVPNHSNLLWKNKHFKVICSQI